MVAKRVTKEDQLRELDRRQRAGAIVEEVGQTARVLIVMGGLAFIVWCGYQTVVSLAGKATDANIILNILGHLEISVALAWGVGAGGVYYGYSQNRLRKRTVRHMHTRVQQLETLIDPARTSSQLDDSGNTNPKDK